VSDPDFLNIVIIYDRTAKITGEFEEVYIDFIREYKGLFRTLVYDCTDDEELCKEEVRPNLPIITAYKPTGMNPYTGRPDVENEHFTGTTSTDNLSKYIGKMMPYFGKSVTDKTREEFMSHKEPKFLLFSNKKKPTSVIKALTSEFRDRMHFGYVHKDQIETVNTFSPPEIPCLMALKDDGEHAVFDGEFTFDEMTEWMSEHVLPEKWETKQVDGKVSEMQKEMMV
jgi:hypothetical protein